MPLDIQRTTNRTHGRTRKVVLYSAVLIVLAGITANVLWQQGYFTPKSNTVNVVATPAPKAKEDPTKFTPIQPSDPSYGVIANKKHPLSPLKYAPSDLVAVGSQQMRRVAAEAVLQMQKDSGSDISLIPASGYRSYDRQVSVYNSFVARDGQAEADTTSARPGYSEHQTGLVMDFSPIDDAFADTVQFTWLQNNAYKYGFVLRYPKNKTDITGYMFEPWHWRYVGIEVATDMHTRNIETLEEYYGVTGGDY